MLTSQPPQVEAFVPFICLLAIAIVLLAHAGRKSVHLWSPYHSIDKNRQCLLMLLWIQSACTHFIRGQHGANCPSTANSRLHLHTWST